MPDYLTSDGNRAYIGVDPRRNTIKIRKSQRLPLSQCDSKRRAEAGVTLIIGFDCVPNIGMTSCVESGGECQPRSVWQLAHDMSLDRAVMLAN